MLHFFFFVFIVIGGEKKKTTNHIGLIGFGLGDFFFTTAYS